MAYDLSGVGIETVADQARHARDPERQPIPRGQKSMYCFSNGQLIGTLYGLNQVNYAQKPSAFLRQ